jgi:hypothetical protein
VRKESASWELSPLPVWKAVSLLGYYDPLGHSTEIAALAVEEERAAPSASAASAVGAPDGAARYACVASCTMRVRLHKRPAGSRVASTIYRPCAAFLTGSVVTAIRTPHWLN